MPPIDLKTKTPIAAPANALLFGAQSTGATDPDLFFRDGIGDRAAFHPRLGPSTIRGCQFNVAAIANNTGVAANTLYAVPLHFARDETVNKLGLRFGGASAGVNCRLGLYRNKDGLPGEFVVESGEIAAASASYLDNAGSLAAVVARGDYWGLFVCSGSLTGGIWTQTVGTAATYNVGFSTASGSVSTAFVTGYSRAFTYGALPTTDQSVETWSTLLGNAGNNIPLLLWGR
ncbi:MAG: hypothetical protein NW216_07635 [Hyphomicrobium sp.]|nr:hypothetical protein [Hyphomicrobium sp.]